MAYRYHEFDIDTLTIYDPEIASAILSRLEEYVERTDETFLNCDHIFQELLLDSVDLAIDTRFADPTSTAVQIRMSARGRTPTFP